MIMSQESRTATAEHGEMVARELRLDEDLDDKGRVNMFVPGVLDPVGIRLFVDRDEWERIGQSSRDELENIIGTFIESFKMALLNSAPEASFSLALPGRKG